MTLHAIQIVASIDNQAAGPSTTVRRLAECLSKPGVDSELYCVGDPALNNGLIRRYPPQFEFLPVLGHLKLSAPLRAALYAAASQSTVFHSHGLWLMPNVYPGTVARHQNMPLVLSPRGMLGPAALEFSKLKKQAFWSLFQKRAMASVACFHATASSEVEDIRAIGLRAPVAIVPNGIDIPEVEATHLSTSQTTSRTLLHLGRIHPKKGIDRLLQAWSQLEPEHTNWTLRIVGPGEAPYIKALEHFARELRLNQVKFEQPVYGNEKLKAYREADLFVLPTLHENFGMVVAEALATGVPVICSKGAPWGGLVEKGCGWWVDHSSDALAAALSEGMCLGAETRAAMGHKGRKWMREDFSWDSVAGAMEQVYLWCLGQADRPNFVVV